MSSRGNNSRRPSRPTLLQTTIRFGMIGFMAGSTFALFTSTFFGLRGGYRGIDLAKIVISNTGRSGLAFGSVMAIAGALRS